MAIVSFPPVDKANEDGLLAIGGDLEPESLLLAYRSGIFPWPFGEDFPLAWFSPNPRGILSYKNLRINRSLKKAQKKFQVCYNKNFHEVILHCSKSKNRKDQTGTWITRPMIEAYENLFKLGHAFSVESYREGHLVGGLYGVHLNGFISAESMFYLEPNASKVALISLSQHLFKKNICWIDTQTLAPIVEQLGGMTIERQAYLRILQIELKKNHDQNLFV